MQKKKFALIGYPLAHSMSVPVHKKLFEMSGICEAEYDLIELPPEAMEEKMPCLLSLDGFNVTIPHKVKIIKYLDRLSESAMRYGSVNVVKCGEEAVGYNTDSDGFLSSIKMLGASFDQNKVLLLGCGGVGRMMAIEAACSGAFLTIAVLPEDLASAQRAVDDIALLSKGHTPEIKEITKLRPGFDIIINATPAGMYPHTDISPIHHTVLEGASFLFDAVYNPAKTLLMRQADEYGVKTLGGMAMLCRQAAKAHEIWYGASFKETELSALISGMEKEV